MRNRVPGRKTRSLVTVRLTGLVALFMLVPAQLAFAQGSTTTSMPVTFGGPLAIAVAGLGLTGMLLGLWRFRRKLVRDRAAATEVMPVVDSAVELAVELVGESRTPATAPTS